MAYYVRTSVRLKFGQNRGWNDMMSHVVPFMERHGWKMAFALQPFLGDATELVHIWEVERFEDIERALRAAAADPDAHAALGPITSLVDNEVMQIMVKTPYSG